ncbi:cysteine desulfurase family protein [Halalkalibacterium ligniniphilum]|uniref:cysteine desulfurase family protein n=1 Tax=Halalkalibacterium ligniniphilum TaxID=1134413 RepID=UPI00034CAB4E|nr:cysteine desulfurase family protein [Halalkalibacterium ligniniphilum]
MIYLDNSATTQPYREVIEAYQKAAFTYFGNPSSLHGLGLEAEKILTLTREQIARLVFAKPNEIIYTSGGTEGNNLAIKGTAFQLRGRGNHLVTSAVEHPSSLEAFTELENLGFHVTYVKPNERGLITADMIEAALTEQTTLVSILHVNNETGTVQPIEEIGKRLRHYKKIRFHIDHVQGATKVPISFQDGYYDLATFSAHKFHGLKGMGFLYKKEGVLITPLFHGGGQEQNVRGGTEHVAGAVSMAKALRLSIEQFEHKKTQLMNLRNKLMDELETIKGVILNTDRDHSAPHIVNFSVPGMKPEVLIQALSAKEIYVSTKSACSSKKTEPSHVLLGMGMEKARAESAIRVSLSFQNTKEEVEMLVKELHKQIPKLLEVLR